MRWTRWPIGGLVAAIMLTAGPRAQVDPSRHTAAAWWSAVDAHRPGQLDAAATQVAVWSRLDLENAFADLRRAPPPNVSGVWKRAAMLHADIAILKRSATGYDLPPDDHAVVMIRDGKQIGARSGTVHWAFARKLLDAVREPSNDDDVRRWYRAIGAFLQAWNEFPELGPHLVRGRELFPADPLLIVYAGTVHENFAEPSIQNAFAQMIPLRSGAPPPRPPVDLPSAERRQAIALFRQALAIDSMMPEALVRLGYAYGQLQQHREAIGQLELAAKQTMTPLWQYYTWVLLGREQQAAGELTRSRISFERAAALSPTAQAPRLGLSQLARDLDDLPGALAPLALFAVPGNIWGRDEPLWQFHKVHLPDAEALVAELRRQSSARPGNSGSIRSSRGPFSSHTAN